MFFENKDIHKLRPLLEVKDALAFFVELKRALLVKECTSASDKETLLRVQGKLQLLQELENLPNCLNENYR
jgi:hypothetical protein